MQFILLFTTDIGEGMNENLEHYVWRNKI